MEDRNWQQSRISGEHLGLEQAAELHFNLKRKLCLRVKQKVRTRNARQKVVVTGLFSNLS